MLMTFLAAFEIEQDLLNFLIFLNNRHPKIKFTMENQTMENQTILLLFFMYSFQVSIIIISPLKHVTNGPIHHFF